MEKGRIKKEDDEDTAGKMTRKGRRIGMKRRRRMMMLKKAGR